MGYYEVQLLSCKLFSHSIRLRIARNTTQNYPTETTQLWSVWLPYWTDSFMPKFSFFLFILTNRIRITAMKSIRTTADRIRIFENTIRLSADFLIVSANAIRKTMKRYILEENKLIAWYNKLAILKNSIDKKKDRNYLFEIRRERGFFWFSDSSDQSDQSENKTILLFLSSTIS